MAGAVESCSPDRAIVRLLVQQGADINARDTEFGATPAGWAIEYLREMGAWESSLPISLMRSSGGAVLLY